MSSNREWWGLWQTREHLPSHQRAHIIQEKHLLLDGNGDAKVAKSSYLREVKNLDYFSKAKSSIL